MKNIKRYIDFIKEDLSPTKIDTLLDKISRFGLNKLSPEERGELYRLSTDDSEPEKDKVEIDSEGDIRVNDERINPYHIPDEYYDDGTGQEDRELTSDLQEEILWFLSEEYFKSGHVIVDVQTEQSVPDVKIIIRKITNEFGISEENSDLLLKFWYKS